MGIFRSEASDFSCLDTFDRFRQEEEVMTEAGVEASGFHIACVDE